VTRSLDDRFRVFREDGPLSGPPAPILVTRQPLCHANFGDLLIFLAVLA
jgi:hypothetical protein